MFIMKKAFSAVAFIVCTMFTISAWGQSASAASSLYQAFGEKAGLTQLVDQFCVVTGGPCVYKGADMKSAHSNLDINKGDFNTLVEVLQQSMDAKGIPFATQNKLLARLAPMHRDIITVN